MLAGILLTASSGRVDPAAAQTVQSDLDLTDGPVYAIAVAGNTIYLGGQFTRVSLASQHGAVVSTSGRLLQPVNFDSRPFASAPDGAGGWFIAGEFGYVNGLQRDGVAHILADGSVAPWAPSVGARVLSMAVSGSTVYVAGEFNDVNGEPRNHVAAIDAVTGELTSWNPNAGNVSTTYISAVVVSSGTVYVGGLFPQMGTVARSNIAAIDSATGIPTAWNPQSDHEVLTLAVRGSTIYVGGRFNTIGGQARSRIAALDGGTGLATPWDPVSDSHSDIDVIVPTADAIYVGGGFTNIGGAPRQGVAALDPTTGTATDWAPVLAGPYPGVRGIALAGSTVYLGGQFDSIDGVVRHNLAAVDAITGQVAGWDPGPDEAVITLAIQDSMLFAGGAFRGIAGPFRQNLAAIDRTTHHVTDWNPGANGAVRALVVDYGEVFAGGSFDVMGGHVRRRLAAFDLGTGALTGWDPDADGAVRALAVRRSTLYAGGAFKHVGGQPRNRLAALDLASGVPSSWDPGADSTVRAIAVGDDMLYVGGSFQQLAGQPRSRMGAVDFAGAATTWQADVTGDNPDVYALAVSGPLVYAGGDFFQVSGQPRAYLAALDRTTGAVAPFHPSFYATAYAIAVGVPPVDSGIVYVAGVDQLRAYDDAGQLTGWAPNFSGAGYSIVPRQGAVYVGGDFSWVGSYPRQGIAALEADHTTPTLLLRFDAEPTANGIRLRWQLEDPLAGASWLERADDPQGPWTPLEIPILPDGDQLTAFDASIEPGRLYAYRIVADIAGRSVPFAPIVVRASTPPGALDLAGIVPNPTAGVTAIDYVAPREAHVRLVVLDTQGRLVARLVDGTQGPGRHRVVWALSPHDALPAGIYFVRCTAAGRSISRRLVLTR